MNAKRTIANLSLLLAVALASTGCKIINPTIEPPDSNGPWSTFESAEMEARRIKSVMQSRINTHRNFDFATGVLTLGATAGAGALGGFGAHRDTVLGTLVGAATVGASRTFVPFEERIKIINEGKDAISCSIMAAKTLHEKCRGGAPATPTPVSSGGAMIAPSPQGFAFSLPTELANVDSQSLQKLRSAVNAPSTANAPEAVDRTITKFKRAVLNDAEAAAQNRSKAAMITAQADNEMQQACRNANNVLRDAVLAAVDRVNSQLNGLAFKADDAKKAAAEEIQKAITQVEQTAKKAEEELKKAEEELEDSGETAAKAGESLSPDVPAAALENVLDEGKNIKKVKSALDALIEQLGEAKKCFHFDGHGS